MTYASDTVRFLFHKLPAERQLDFANMEERLAKHLHRLHIDAVMSHDGHSEIIIRISFDYQGHAGPSNR